MRTPRCLKIYPNQTKNQTQHPGTCHKDHLSFIPHFPPPPFWKKPMSNELFLSLLKRCVSTKTLQQIHTQTLINSVNISTSLLSKLIHLKDFNYASLLFSHLPQPNDYAFNIIIRAFTTTWQKYNLTLKSYYQMKSLGLKPDNFTYPFVFIACANLLALDHGQVAHSMVFKNGLNAHGHVSHSLISMYARCRELGYARKVFDEIRDRDLVSWNSIISGYSKMGFAADAVAMFGKMRDEGFEPNEMTIVSVLGACGDLGDLSLGRWAEGFVVSIDMKMNSYIGSALIGMYSKCGDLSSARRVFDRMKNKDVVTWNAMITGYAQNGLSDEAMMLFNSMKVVGVHPDKITLVGMLSASASIGALDFGKSIDAYASERGFQHDIYVGTALVDMYAKCGSMGQALRVFEGMPQKNEVTWNAMISALAFHGQAQEALLLFKCMSEDHVASCPNDITFVAVLSACVHAGFVDEGHRLFSMMKSYYGLVPKIEHYSCMVDLLARAGRVSEAWDFIEKMPEKPDEVILGALLGACQKLRNVHIGEKVIQLLLEMEPSNSGNYVISSKIYANLKKWDDSARMRVLMRQKGVTKTPGCSWIETEAQVHEFLSGSSFYLYSEQIHEVLELLYDDMKMRGYWPNVNLL